MQTSTKKNSSSPFHGFLPFFWMALVFTGGILIADWSGGSPWMWAGGGFLCLLALILGFILPKSLTVTCLLRAWTQIDRRLPGAVLAVVFFLGAWRYAATRPVVTKNHPAYYNDRGWVEIIGKVVQPPDIRDQTINLVVQTQSLSLQENKADKAGSVKVNGLVLVQVQPGGDWAYGDVLRVKGELQTPYEGADFSYREYLARKGILSLMPYAHAERINSGGGSPIKIFLYNLKHRGYHILHVLFPFPESELLSGILLGRDEGLSSDLQEAFRRTGTTHIIAISGFNMAILAHLFSSLFARLMGRRWGALAAILAIIGYTILVGAGPAVVRAAIMGGIGVFGGMFGRRQNGLNSLGLAGLAMMVVDPNIPWDVGFQLSIAATSGLVLYAQPLEERLLQTLGRWLPEEKAQQWTGPLSEFFLFTLAAQVMTLPLILYHFKGVSWLALVANPLILPPQTLVMILGGMAMLAGMILPGLGILLTIVALPFVRYTIRMVSWLSHLPGSDLVCPQFNPLWLVLFYGVLFLLTLFPSRQLKKIRERLLSPVTGLLLLAGLVVFTWTRILTKPDGRLHLTLLDEVGTVLIQTPNGDAVLIGGGTSPSSLNQALGEMLPAGKRSLDAVIIGSAARDDLNALTGTLTIYDAGLVVWGVDPEVNQTTAGVYSLLLNKDTLIHPMEAGQVLDLGGEGTLDVRWVGERGAVLWLEWGDFAALLPTGKVEDHWHNVQDAPDVLLLPDGLKAEDVFLWKINMWEPSVVLLPLAKADLPLLGEHDLLELFEGYPLVNTLEHGWVRITSDGKHLWINSEW